MNFGQNLYQWFLSNAQSLVLMSIVDGIPDGRYDSWRENGLCRRGFLFSVFVVESI